MSKKVILYARVSTEEQAEGYSPQSQIAKLTEYCHRKGWTIVKIFEEHYSAKEGFNRPAYNKLIDYISINKKSVDHILFTQWSRFSRDTAAAYHELYRLNDLGVRVNAIEQWININNPDELILLAIYLAAPQVENRRLSQRVKAAVIQGRKEGKCMGKAPLGYINDKISKSVILHPENSEIVRFCFGKFSEGIYSAEEVRRMGQERGLKLRKQSFLDMLKNKFYIGKISVPEYEGHPEEIVDGIHDALISSDIFEKVQYILRGKKKPYKGNTKNDEVPLIGNLICPKCNKIMTGSGSKGNGGIYHYYHCQRKYGCNNNIKAKIANKKFEEYLRLFEPKPEVLELYKKIFENKFISETTSIDHQKKDIEKEIDKVDEKIKMIEESFLDERLPYLEYRKFKDRLEEKKSDLIMKHATLKQMPSEFAMYLKYGLSLVGNISGFYIQANTTIKKKIVSSIFPENLIFENNEYRTTKTNTFFALLSNGGKGLGKKKADTSIGLSIFAPPSGLEPETL